MEIQSTPVRTTLGPIAELDRLGDQIAVLSADLEVATVRLLDLIREFDARGGWCNGFRSCAHWLSWRIGLDLGAAREKVRVLRCSRGVPRRGVIGPSAPGIIGTAVRRGPVPGARGAGRATNPRRRQESPMDESLREKTKQTARMLFHTLE